MTLANQIKVRGNLLPEGMTVPRSAVWPPDAEDGQLIWKTPEEQLYLYRAFPLDIWYPVGAGGSLHFEPVQDQVAKINATLLADVRSNFFPGLLQSRSSGTWATIHHHCYWQFISPASDTVWTDPRKFSTENDFFTYLESYVPNDGTQYSENVRCRSYELIDDADPFPCKLHFRNSLAASIMGKKRWQNKGYQYYGVDWKFNASYYYSNFYNELGQRFVIEATAGTDPGSNNDDVVWYHRGKRGTLLRFPMIGSSIGGGGRGAAWDQHDTPALRAYVSPAPSTGYAVKDPFYLVEGGRGSFLSITPEGADFQHRVDELTSPVVAVFPLVSDDPPHHYYSFMLVPVNYDNFVTEKVDTGTHEMSLCIHYRGTYGKIYDVAPQQVMSGLTNQMTMWVNPSQMCSHRNPNRLHSDIDGDFIPTHVDLARRELATGKRSNWVPLYQIRRHTPHAGFKITPVRNGR
jgi:hypothetical protein